MNEELVADLKQFITATVSQATAELPTKRDLGAEINGLRLEMDQRFDEATLQRNTIADAQAVDWQEHERRISKLERRIV